jgi:hypothetical protein
MAELTLGAFARKVAGRSDTLGTASCLTRAANHIVLVLVQRTLASLGTSAADPRRRR